MNKNDIIQIFEKGLEILGKEVDRETAKYTHYTWECTHYEPDKRYITKLEYVELMGDIYLIGKCPEGCLFWMKEDERKIGWR